jgi:tetratricopeptide (TPR) repeat protein
MFSVILLFAAAVHPCLPCHSGEVERFSKSAMGNSIARPANEPAGEFDHRVSGGRMRLYWKEGELRHRIEQSGLTADLPAAYAIGFGNVGKSYLVEIGGHLFQSPAAFYSAKHAWAESPGYEADPVLDFWRPIDSSCLSCHTGSVQQTGNTVTLGPITCDRCHGDPVRHLRNPVPGSIVNPAKLTGRERDSVCEQCHLEGATSILNPGKHWGDFKPGGVLENVQITYILRAKNTQLAELAAVSHAEQLALSACKRAEPAKLWCATCHDPHSPAGDHRAQINGVCGSCHPRPELASSHQPSDANCVACHMPKLQATDISHAAITDHRILKRPTGTPVQSHAAEQLVPWQPPLPALTNRDLGLALFNLARSGRPQGSYPEAFRLLSEPGSSADATVESAQGYMLLGSGHAESAIEHFRRAIAADDGNPEYWLELGVAQQAAGGAAAAEISYEESIRRNRADYRAYQALAALQKQNGRTTAASQTLAKFLSVYPQSILIRLKEGS